MNCLELKNILPPARFSHLETQSNPVFWFPLYSLCLCGESFCPWAFFRLSETTEQVFSHPLEIINCFSIFSISIEETLSMHYRAV